MHLQVTCLKYKNTSTLKIKEKKTTYHANTNQKYAGIAIAVSDKTISDHVMLPGI